MSKYLILYYAKERTSLVCDRKMLWNNLRKNSVMALFSNVIILDFTLKIIGMRHPAIRRDDNSRHTFNAIYLL